MLVGGDWNMTFMTFHSIGNVVSSQLTFTPSFFRGVGERKTTSISPIPNFGKNCWIPPLLVCLIHKSPPFFMVGSCWIGYRSTDAGKMLGKILGNFGWFSHDFYAAKTGVNVPGRTNRDRDMAMSQNPGRKHEKIHWNSNIHGLVRDLHIKTIEWMCLSGLGMGKEKQCSLHNINRQYIQYLRLYIITMYHTNFGA